MNFMVLISILNALCENDKQILNEIMLELNPLELGKIRAPDRI